MSCAADRLRVNRRHCNHVYERNDLASIDDVPPAVMPAYCPGLAQEQSRGTAQLLIDHVMNERDIVHHGEMRALPDVDLQP